MMKNSTTISLLFVLIVSSNGWTNTPQPNNIKWPRVNKKVVNEAGIFNRKGFLETAGTAVVGVAGAVVLEIGNPSVATAGDKPTASNLYYQPPKDSLRGKVIVITGGTAGLGLESAKRLAGGGATIVLTSRTPIKGETAVQAVNAYIADQNVATAVYSLSLDLDDLDNVKAFPLAYQKLGLGKIDVLINNAGVMAIPDRQLTKDGYERTFQSNHLGHFVLTAGLYPLFSRAQTRIINVSSLGYTFAKEGKGQGLDLDNLNGENQYGPWSSYGLTKLANIMFTQELQRRADTSGDGSWLTAVALHPGAVSTDLGRYLVGEEKWNDLKTKGPSGLESFVLNGMQKFIKTVPDGASTQIYLAAGADGTLQKAAFYNDMKPTRNLPAFATDQSKAEKLWEKSEQLGGVVFNISKQ